MLFRSLDGQVVAESERVIVLHELRLGPAYHFPMEDMRAEYPEPSERTSFCALKGDARYWTQNMGHRTEADIVWGNEQRDTNVAANEAASIKALTNALDRPAIRSGQFRKYFPDQPVSLGPHVPDGGAEELRPFTLPANVLQPAE